MEAGGEGGLRNRSFTECVLLTAAVSETCCWLKKQKASTLENPHITYIRLTWHWKRTVPMRQKVVPLTDNPLQKNHHKFHLSLHIKSFMFSISSTKKSQTFITTNTNQELLIFHDTDFISSATATKNI